MLLKRLIVFVGAFAAVVSPAAAQRAAGPYEGILGASEPGDARHMLTARASIYGVWEDVSSEAENLAPANPFLRSGFAGGASAGLAHARRTRRNQWLSSADTVLRVYGSGDDPVAAIFSGRSGLTSSLSSRISFSGAVGFLYSPFYELAPALDQRFTTTGGVGGGFGVATADQRNTSIDGDVALNVRLSRRDTLEVGANGRRYNFLDEPESDITWYSGRASVRHVLTRTLGIHGGYSRGESKYESALTPPLRNDTIDVGVDYGDTLQFSRRTAVSFTTSTSVLRWIDETHFRLNASASLTRAFGRTGSGSVQYIRDNDFSPGFREPLLTDTISGAYSDQIGRRTSWFASGGYTRGTIGFEEESSHYTSHNAGARLTTAVTRHWGIFGDYSYYRYAVPPGATFFTLLPKFSRNSISVGLTMWVPLINDARPATPIR
jgi:hypothetical protein